MLNLRDKLLMYIVRKMTEIEEERRELRINIRTRPMDSLDIYEYMRMEIRLEVWDEFINDLNRIIAMRETKK